MDDLTFLDLVSESCGGKATLKVVLADSQVVQISDRVSPFRFLDRCALLYHAFELDFLGRLQASFEAPSVSSAIALVRYCYTNNYLPECDDAASAPLLLHAHTYRLAEIFDIPELELLAHGNLACQMDFACSRPTPPEDLLETIRFVYQNFGDAQPRLQNCLINTLCNYCISTFLYHKLGGKKGFMNLVCEIPEFGQDLCITNMDRNFEDDCALDIIRLSLNYPNQKARIQPTLLTSRALPMDIMLHEPDQNSQALPEDSPDGVMQDAIEAATEAAVKNAIDRIHDGDEEVARDYDAQSKQQPPNVLTLVHRLRMPQETTEADHESDAVSDDDGFTLVYRPRQQASSTPDDVMSSPELIPARPVDVLAAMGSDYPSDDEWTLLEGEH